VYTNVCVRSSNKCVTNNNMQYNQMRHPKRKILLNLLACSRVTQTLARLIQKYQ
jgi:hypothetical protein